MKSLILVLLFFSLFLLPMGSAKENKGKYQQLSIELEALTKTQATERELLASIRKFGGFRAIQGTRFVGKAGAVNFPGHVRLKILKDGNWDLVTEVSSNGLDFKTEHFSPTRAHQLFVFSNSKHVRPETLTKTDRPTMVVFMPAKIIVVVTDGKCYYLLNRPDLAFAELTYKLKTKLGE